MLLSREYSTPTLIILVGLSGSGKSTYAKQKKDTELDKNWNIVSSDSIREELCGNCEDQSKNKEVFEIFHKRIKSLLSERQNVIADATNLTIKYRRAILDCTDNFPFFVIKQCIVFSKPFNYCRIDNSARKHPVPQKVLYKQISNFQIPFLEEGFDSIIVHHLINEKRKQLSELLPVMTSFDQKNPHHKCTLDVHCSRVYTLMLSYILFEGFELGGLLHDIGKVFTQTLDEKDIAHYYNHENYGSYFVLSQLDRKDSELFNICFLINYHMLPFGWNTEKAKKRWKTTFGERKYNILREFHEIDAHVLWG